MTPMTEAGRKHEDYCRTFMGDDAAKEVLAIEQEAAEAERARWAVIVREYREQLAIREDDPDPDDVATEILALLDPHSDKL